MEPEIENKLKAERKKIYKWNGTQKLKKVKKIFFKNKGTEKNAKLIRNKMKLELSV